MATTMAHPTSGSGRGDDLGEIWSRLSRPFDVIATVSALVGLPVSELTHVVGADLANSPEAESLMAAMPRILRSLATSLQTQTERCVGGLRGPILWSETMSARASSFGDDGVFICKTPSRAYDIDENRILVAALNAVRSAAKEAEIYNPHANEDPIARAARHRGLEAGRYLEHPSLALVTRERPHPRSLKRTRSGKHRKYYMPAIAMLERTAEPLDLAAVDKLRDERTRAQHRALIGIVRRLESRGGASLPPFRVEHGALFSGPVQYHHSRHLGDREAVSGIVVGQLLVDVPERLHDPSRSRAEALLRAAARGHNAMVVFTESDLDRAVELAIELAAG